MISKNHLAFAGCILFLCAGYSFGGSEGSSGPFGSCLKFSSPSAENAILTPVCTLAVEAVGCARRIKKVEFGARYFQAQSDTATIQSLSTITREPFIFIWNIAEIPNQLFSGATIFADVTFSNDNIESLRKEGIFCIHQPIQRPTYGVAYNFSGTSKLTGGIITLPSYRSNLRIRSSIYWNEKDLSFIIDVRDPLFTQQLSREQLASVGVEILLDPVKSRKPYPGKDVFMYSIPLNGKPYRIEYHQETSDSGGFKLVAITTPCEFSAKIIKKEGKGFLIHFPLPTTILGNRLPETIGANIVVKTLSNKKDIIRSSWVTANTFDTYSPYLWGELQLQSKSIFMNRFLITVVFFGAGFLITLLIAAIIMLISRPAIKKVSAQSDADRQQFLLIKEEFDRKVTGKNVTVDMVGKAVSMPPKKLAALITRATGMNFQTYIMYARIEIAKERLRSSHASMDSIAEACGFANVNEMEKYFVRFCHITPSKFRAEQQVA
jgi:AraC-like DNA-binding protein